MSEERVSHTVFGDFYSGASSGKKDRYGTKTFDLQELIDKVGRYVSVTTFLNEKERDGQMTKSISLIFNKSEAKYLPRSADAGAAAQSPGPVPGRNEGIRRV